MTIMDTLRLVILRAELAGLVARIAWRRWLWHRQLAALPRLDHMKLEQRP
jgi:hypothetical protein